MGVAAERLLHEHPAGVSHPPAGERRHDRRELARQDCRSARLAELVSIREVLGRAADLIDRGWLQEAWFSYRRPDGDVRVSYVPDRRRAREATVLSTCLVAAIRETAVGPERTSEQVLRRALELTWYTLHSQGRGPIQWCPAPDVHALHLRDLTRWNDRAGRTSSEVGALLSSAMRVADVERSRIAAV